MDAILKFYFSTLITMSLSAAHADPPRSRAQTQNGGGKPTPAVHQTMTPAVIFNAKLDDLLHNVTNDVIADFESGKRVAFGREDEVDRLRLNLMAAGSDYGVVEIEGERGVGKSTLVEQYILLEGDLVFRLDLDKLNALRMKSEVEMAQHLSANFQYLRYLAQKSPHSKVILWITDTAALKAGTLVSPVNVLADALAQKNGFLTILESAPGDLSESVAEVFKKYPKLRSTIIRQSILPADYALVYDILLAKKSDLERRAGREITLDALREAARLKVTFYKNKGLDVAEKLVLAGGHEAMVRDNPISNRAAQIKAANDLKRAELEFHAIAQEVAARPNSGYEDQFEVARKKLESAKLNAENSLKNGPSGSSPKIELARVDSEIAVNQARQDELRSVIKQKSTVFNWERTRQNEVLALDNRLAILQSERLTIQNKIKKPIDNKVVSADHVLLAASRWLGQDVDQLTRSFRQGLDNFHTLKDNNIIIGQDYALERIRQGLLIRHTKSDGRPAKNRAEAAAIVKGEIDNTVKPIFSYWFAGSTGVGKTETAKQVADLIGYKMFVFNMSEFGEKHMIARLTGAPAGYVGYGEEGELTGKVREVPNCVILLDEIEKADPSILKILLQITDAGMLSDGQGRMVKFNHVILIATSNLAQDVAKLSMDELLTEYQRYSKTQSGSNAAVEDPDTGKLDFNRLRSEVYKYRITDPKYMGEQGLKPILPELVGRFTNFIVFNDINEIAAIKIFQKFLDGYRNNLEFFQDIKVEFSSEAYQRISERFKTKEGGRSMDRVLDDLLRGPIAEMIYSRKAKPGDHVIVDIGANGAYSRKVIGAQDYAVIKAAATADLSRGLQAQLTGLNKANTGGRALPEALAKGEMTRSLETPEYILEAHFMKRIRSFR